jgi:hypothetical protein
LISAFAAIIQRKDGDDCVRAARCARVGFSAIRTRQKAGDSGTKWMVAPSENMAPPPQAGDRSKHSPRSGEGR